MHPDPTFRVSERAILVAGLRARPFCTIAVAVDGRPVLAHAPVLVRADGAALEFHLSRGGPLRDLPGGAPAVVAQLGPDAYVSPDWYVSEDQVPTWNYLLIEAEGRLQRLDEAELHTLLEDLSAQEEARLAPKQPWTAGKMSAGRFEAIARAVVGYRLTIERLEGVSKLSQNKAAADRAGVIAALKDQPLGALIPRD